MKTFILLSLFLLVQQSVQEDAAPACHDLFEANRSICSKFNFIIDPQVVY